MIGQALNDNVLIEVFDALEKTTGGIFIPQIAQQKPDKGRVISVGETVKDSNIKEGITVYAVKGCLAKNNFEVAGKTYSLVKDYDLQLLIPQEN